MPERCRWWLVGIVWGHSNCNLTCWSSRKLVGECWRISKDSILPRWRFCSLDSVFPNSQVVYPWSELTWRFRVLFCSCSLFLRISWETPLSFWPSCWSKGFHSFELLSVYRKFLEFVSFVFLFLPVEIAYPVFPRGFWFQPLVFLCAAWYCFFASEEKGNTSKWDLISQVPVQGSLFAQFDRWWIQRSLPNSNFGKANHSTRSRSSPCFQSQFELRLRQRHHCRNHYSASSNWEVFFHENWKTEALVPQLTKSSNFARRWDLHFSILCYRHYCASYCWVTFLHCL